MEERWISILGAFVSNANKPKPNWKQKQKEKKRKKESTQQNPPLARFLVSSFSPFKLLSFMPFPPSSSSSFLFLFQVLSLSISLSLPLFFSNLVLHLFIFRFYVFVFLIGVSFLVVLWICSFSRFSSIITPSSSSFRVVGSACGWNNEICVSALNLFFEFEIFVVSGTFAISVFGLFSRFTFVVVLHVFLSFFFFFFFFLFFFFFFFFFFYIFLFDVLFVFLDFKFMCCFCRLSLIICKIRNGAMNLEIAGLHWRWKIGLLLD